MSRSFYVTVMDAGKVGWLLGPYETHDEALGEVERGRRLANDANAWACFYAYGTASLPADGRQPRTVFQKGESNA